MGQNCGVQACASPHTTADIPMVAHTLPRWCRLMYKTRPLLPPMSALGLASPHPPAALTSSRRDTHCLCTSGLLVRWPRSAAFSAICTHTRSLHGTTDAMKLALVMQIATQESSSYACNHSPEASFNQTSLPPHKQSFGKVRPLTATRAPGSWYLPQLLRMQTTYHQLPGETA